MRPHGRAQISARSPRAVAVCQRCGFLYNLDNVTWQWDWQQGPRLFNLRIQVCPPCLDIPQESGRTIVLPPDPIPVKYPLPENYVGADNPLSYLGYNVASAFFPQPPQSLGGNIGNMTLNGGVDAAFNSVANKPAEMCASLPVSNAGYLNTVGKNWNAFPSGVTLTLPSTVAPVTHVVSSFTLVAPNDRPFLNSPSPSTGYFLQGSANGLTWATIFSGTTAGTVGETIAANTNNGTFYQYHQIAMQGDGFSSISIAQAILNVSDAAPNDI